jgi:hypothetical protein
MKSRYFFLALFVALLIWGASLRLKGMSRSFWADEVWVANTLTAPTLSQMFFPETWLQTSPPLFLLVNRFVGGLLGQDEFAFRLFPALMGIAAILCFVWFLKQNMAPHFAVLGAIFLIFCPDAVDLSRQLKQYSSELAATSLILLAFSHYLQARSHRRFLVLLGATVVAISLGYGTFLLLPGLFFGIVLSNQSRQAAIHSLLFVACCFPVLLLEYFWLVQNNSSEMLSNFWQFQDRGLSFARTIAQTGWDLFHFAILLLPKQLMGSVKSILAALVIAALVSAGLIDSWFHRTQAFTLRLLAYSTLGLAILLHRFSVYPVSNRTSLFLAPIVIFLVVDGLEVVCRLVRPAWIGIAVALLVTVAIPFRFIDRPIAEGNRNFEDFRGAMAFMKASSQAEDSVWVFGGAAEAYRYYSRLLDFKPFAAYTGSIGWPCCPRNSEAASFKQEADFRNDFDLQLPSTLPGKLWLISSVREDHLKVKAINESTILESILKSRACEVTHQKSFYQVSLSAWTCPAAKLN